MIRSLLSGRRLVAFLPALAFALLCLVAWLLRPSELGRWAIYGLVSFGYLTIKLVASYAHSTEQSPVVRPFSLVVGAVVPAHNEDAEVLRRCVTSLSNQVDHFVVVDDGSRDEESRKLILDLGNLPNVDVFCFDNNRGKRVGLRVGVEHLMASINPHYIVTVDSDTVAHPGAVTAAIHELEKNPEVGATTAVVRARNWKTNFLTRIQDLRYANAFLWERAAYSQAGAVLCVCGSFTAWRAEVLSSSVEKLTDQTFLGRECTYGDDRHLTNLALAAGWKVTLCERAMADTMVPENLDHFRRQQVRWSKSFFRESVWALRNLPNGWAKALTFAEISTWVVFSLVLVFSLVVRPVLSREIALFQVALWIGVMSWARSVRFFDARPEATIGEKVYSFLLAPIYGFIHVAVLLPLRCWAMLTLTDTEWGTRKGVEVSENSSMVETSMIATDRPPAGPRLPRRTRRKVDEDSNR